MRPLNLLKPFSIFFDPGAKGQVKKTFSPNPRPPPCTPRCFLPTHRLLVVALMMMAVAAVHAAPAGFDPAAETERLLSTLPADQRARSDAYFEGGYWLLLRQPLVTLLITAILYRTGVAVKLRDLSERVFKRRFLQALLFVAMLSVALWLRNLP
jgi:STE24 endopeptidase